MPDRRRIAYFCMEVGLRADLPTYSGGLGALAGDTIRAAADLGVPMVAITLIHRHGYCTQRLNAAGNQIEEPIVWSVEGLLREQHAQVVVDIAGRPVRVRAWTYDVVGCSGATVPVVYLDTDVPENDEHDRRLSHHLYGGDSHYRLCQEIVLGIGGVRMLTALGCTGVQRFHMNEGHASLLTLELLRQHAERQGRTGLQPTDVDYVRQRCSFTTHTPVPAGHDHFPIEMVSGVLEKPLQEILSQVPGHDRTLNTTNLAIQLSRYSNGVSRRHGEVSRQMFAPHVIDAITNGVHAPSWAAPPLAELYDRFVPGWCEDSANLRNALAIPSHELWAAHLHAKRRLVHYAAQSTGQSLDESLLTIGFARRAATYKRGDLIFADLNRLLRIHDEVGPFQLVYAGKAHPHDHGGKDLIRRIFQARDALAGRIRVVYLENYDLELCKLMTAGVDLWLNTPEPPLEASGTSGMKAAVNGVPSLSTLDGWWLEGWIEGVTGWAIGRDRGLNGDQPDRGRDAHLLYDKLEYAILPMYWHDRERYVNVMRNAVAINASYFNTHRMVRQYVLRAYL